MTHHSVLPKLRLGIAGWLLVLSLISLGGLAASHPGKASADSGCDPVNIIRCGLDPTSLQNTIDSFKGNYVNGCNGSKCDLKQVYAWAGATSASVANMNTSNTKMGTMFRNGDIKVDGKVVGHDAWVAARFTEGAGFVQISPGVWARKTTTSLAESSAAVIVHFSGNTADFAVMINCGNAVKFTPPPPPPPPPAPQPTLVCDNLKVDQASGTLHFNFHASASATRTTITKYVFDFGDGKQQTMATSSESTVVGHNYTEFGQTFHARVTVFSNDFKDGKTSADCTATVMTPQKPSLVCVSVVQTFTNDPLTNNFTATARPTRTTIQSYTFNYSDGTHKVITTNKLAATDTHTFAKNSTAYQVSVSVTGATADGQTISAKACMLGITTPAPKECKPGVPVGSAECSVQPCPYNAQLTLEDANCKAPVALVNTGPGQVIGAAAGVAMLATGTKLYLIRRKLGL